MVVNAAFYKYKNRSNQDEKIKKIDMQKLFILTHLGIKCNINNNNICCDNSNTINNNNNNDNNININECNNNCNNTCTNNNNNIINDKNNNNNNNNNSNNNNNIVSVCGVFFGGYSQNRAFDLANVKLYVFFYIY